MWRGAGAIVACAIVLAACQPKDDLANQRTCATQAEHRFTSLGYSEAGGPGSLTATYTDHYNGKLNRCFMLLAVNNYSGASIGKSRVLLDAYQNNDYGEYYDIMTLPLVPSPNVASPVVVTCKLTVPGEPIRFCHTQKQWELLIQPYIGSGAITD